MVSALSYASVVTSMPLTSYPPCSDWPWRQSPITTTL